MSPEKLFQAAANAAQAVLAAKDGDYLKAAGHAADLVVDLVPAGGDARKVLDDAIFRRVDAEAALAEQLKFPNE